MSLLPRSCCCCVRISSKAPPSLGPAYRSKMSLPCSTAVGCVVQVRRSKSLCGTDDSHGQSPSRVCPSTPGVVGGIRPAAFDCECGMVALCEPCEGSPSAVNVVIGLDGGVSHVDPAGSSVPEATGSTRSQRWGHCSGECSEGAALHTQPFLRTGQLWERPQFPGHFFLRKWSRQYCTPLGETFAQLAGQSESLPLPAPMVPLLFPPFGVPFGLFHCG